MWRTKLLLLTILLAVAGRSAAQSPAFVQRLSDLVLPMRSGHDEVLWCEFKQAEHILWAVNSLIVGNTIPEPFSFTDAVRTDNATLKATASFPSLRSVNNTVVTCLGFSQDYLNNISSSALLIIVDVPLHPSPKLSMLDFNRLHVGWDAPYSWPSYPITNYNIVVQLSNGFSKSAVLSGSALSHDFNLNYSLNSCTSMTVSLTAENRVGSSLPGTISRSLATAPGDFFEEPDASVTFSKEDLPHVKVSFVFPSLCKNNAATYFLRFYDEQGLLIYTTKQLTAQWDHGGTNTIVDVQNNSIKKNAEYQAILYVNTAGGNTTATIYVDTTRDDQGLINSTEDPKQPGLTRPSFSHKIYIIAAAVAGGFTILLVVIVVVVIIALLCWRRMLKSRKRVCSEIVLKKMITNPVYDNQIDVIYDEIPNDSNKYPQTLPQGLEEYDEGYTSVRSTPVQLRTLPDIKPDNSQDATGEDPYTVMNSIGTVLPRQSLTDDDTVDHAELSRTASRNKRPENQYHFK